MKHEHLHEHFMNTFMNTFLREMNTMNTLRVKYYLIILKKYMVKSVHVLVHVGIHSIKVFIVRINRSKLFIKVFINPTFNCSFFGGL